METPVAPTSIAQRISDGLARLAAAARTDDWSRASSIGLNPAQYSILQHIDGRPAGLGVKELASFLGVSQPSATDSINALERKGLVVKRPTQRDRRVVMVTLTAAGDEALRAVDVAPDPVERAAGALDRSAQENLLVALVSMIRHLQESDVIPIQRMCVSCRYFDPYAHADAAAPHHCHFVNAAFGQQDLRVDCREHETADAAVRAVTWTAFDGGRSTLQASREQATS